MRRLTPEDFEALRRGEIDLSLLRHDDQMGDVGAFTEAAGDAPGQGLGFFQNAVRLAALGILEKSLGPVYTALDAMGAQFPGNALVPVLQAAVRRMVQGALDFVRGPAIGSSTIFDHLSGAQIQDLAAAVRAIYALAGVAGNFPVLIRYLQLTGVPHRVTSTLRPGAIVRGTNIPSKHSVGRAVDFSGPSGGRDTPELLAIYRAFAPVAPPVHRIYSGPGGGGFGRVGGITWQDHHDHVHVDLKHGGIFSPPGVFARVGEAGREVVLPLASPQRALDLAARSGALAVLQRAAEQRLGTPTTTAGSTTVRRSGSPSSTTINQDITIVGVSFDQAMSELQHRTNASLRNSRR
jgi:hypothetical protein